MTRLPGWRGRLMAYVARVRNDPFVYGSADCALFAAGAVAAVTGRDLAAAFRGTYTTLQGGLKAVRREGYIDHIDVARAMFARVDAAQAQTGDLAVVRWGNDEQCLGVVSGGLVLVRRPHGLGQVDLTAAEYGLRV